MSIGNLKKCQHPYQSNSEKVIETSKNHRLDSIEKKTLLWSSKKRSPTTVSQDEATGKVCSVTKL